MSRFPKLTNFVRSAAFALALGSTGLAALPAQAAPPSVGFQFDFWGGGLFIGSDRDCLSDRQVPKFLRSLGYDHVRLFDRRGRVVAVRAKRHHDRYRVWVDTCRARVVDIQLIQHNKLFDEGYTGGGLIFSDLPLDNN